MTTVGPSGYEGADSTVSAQRAVAATPHDTNIIELTRALYVGGAGSIVVTMADGVDCTFTGVSGGTILPIQAKRIKSTGTTATSIVRLY